MGTGNFFGLLGSTQVEVTLEPSTTRSEEETRLHTSGGNSIESGKRSLTLALGSTQVEVTLNES